MDNFRHPAGYPWLAMRMPLVKKELTALLIVEPPICLAFGGAIYLAWPLFGQFLMLCAASLFLKHVVERGIVHKRIQRMRDAEIEQRFYSERLRRRTR